MNQKPELLIAIAVPPGWYRHWSVDITDQEPGVITKRDNTRSLLLRPVDLVAFAKENPSYQGPGNSKNWLLPRLRPVRVHHANQYPVRPLYWVLVYLAASAASYNLAASAAPPITPTPSATLQIRHVENHVNNTPKRQRAPSPSTAFASHEHHNLHHDLR